MGSENCLTAEQLESLVRGLLDGQVAAPLLEHLSGCPACRASLEACHPDASLLAKLKKSTAVDVLGARSVDVASLDHEAHPLAGDQTATTEPRSPRQPDNAPLPHFSTPPPDSFVGYQIIREIHRGGQGVVYQAVQKSTKRRVAIKVMKEGPFATKAERARFEREVEILGQLNHPNIVNVHDSGQAAGHFYYVMDYISGQPLDVWMAGGPRTIEQTLRLFQKICEAVSAAHVKGIIHRDLKPANIRIDENGEPHVLDFGLAKVARGVEEASLMTLTGQFMGSLPWASPEQAEANPTKIDIRTDVYSLGVILYQMLTGKFPYEVAGNMRDVLDRIMKAEPARPSTVRVAAYIPSARSGLRLLRSRSRTCRIDDEVDTITLRCLAKERERRYQSAGELARDIGHYLAGEPIEAKRDSVLYVLRKQLRPYWLRIAISIVFFIVAAFGLLSWASVRLRLRAANSYARLASSSVQFVTDMLGSANRGNWNTNPDLKVREMLDAAAGELESGQTHYEPELEAAVHMSIGRSYQELGLYDKAEAHLRRSVNIRRELPAPEFTGAGMADSLKSLAGLLVDKGDYAAAESSYREALAIKRYLLGNEHLEIAELLAGLGVTLYYKRDYVMAEQVDRDALTMCRKVRGNENAFVARDLSNLALVLEARGDNAGAELLCREALAMRRRLLGENHPAVANSLDILACLLRAKGDHVEANDLQRQADTIRNTSRVQPSAGAMPASVPSTDSDMREQAALPTSQAVIGPPGPD
jgi:serine/threonine protein kinase